MKECALSRTDAKFIRSVHGCVEKIAGEVKVFHVKHTGIGCVRNTESALLRSDMIGARFENRLVVDQHNNGAGEDCNQSAGEQLRQP